MGPEANSNTAATIVIMLRAVDFVFIVFMSECLYICSIIHSTNVL
jgi:hypothetical protein